MASSGDFALDDELPSCARETSFSPYLGDADDDSLRKKKKDGGVDEELDVFSAEKYFSGGIDGDELSAKPEKPWKLYAAIEGEIFLGGNATLSGTQSAGSEASGQSRSSLLKDDRKDPSKNTPRLQRKLLGIFLCSCFDEPSVEIDGNAKETDGRKPASWPGAPKQVRPETGCHEEEKASGGLCPKGESHSAFPLVLTPVVAGNPTMAAGNLSVVGVFEEERKWRTPSMDVFRNISMAKDALGVTSFRRSLTMSPAFTATGGTTRDSDVCSEASSDLFEIEHLPGGPRPPGTARTPAARCYEPSESSIEWSVVTASAANFSDVEDSPPEATRAALRQHHHRPGGLLLGCVSDKVVSIASNTYRVPESVETAELLRRNRSMGVVSPATRYHAEGRRSVDFDRRRAQAHLQ